MAGISRDIIMHQLNISPSFRPNQNQKKKFAHERNLIILDEVERLLKSITIKEDQFPR